MERWAERIRKRGGEKGGGGNGREGGAVASIVDTRFAKCRVILNADTGTYMYIDCI